MIRLKHVLVATDFGEVSEAALTYGRALAQTFGADLHLLHVMENTFLRPIAADPLALKVATYNRLNGRLTDFDRVQLHARAVVEVSDEPADVIVEYAKGFAIDLIVTGTHGRRGAAHVLMGSVAERVVRTAPCPVLTVRHPEREFVVADQQEQLAAARP
jgi:nucleotide-binding universal stress UspA family protein